MQKIGDITNTADSHGEFTNGNVAAGIPPTLLEAEWFNSVQREIINVLSKAGIKPNKNNDAQLAEAISQIIFNGALEKVQNGADIQDKAAFVNNLGLRDTVDRASHSLDTRTGGKVNGNVTTNQLFTQAVTISDGSIAAGKLDAASFEGNNIEIRSWNGIGLNSTYENPNNVASIYFDTRGGSIGLQGDISGPKWGGSFSDWVDRKTQQALTKSANGADIPDKKAFANNLGLTETAYRTIGNGTHQIPDMSFFTSGRDWFKMPDGRTIQYGLVNFSQDNDVFFYAKVRFPIPFTDRPMCVQATLNGMGSVDVYLPNLGIDLKDNMSVDIVLPKQRITRIPREQSVFWIAIGY